MKRTIFALLLAALVLSLIPALSQPATAEELTVVEKGIEITTTAPTVGMNINELTASVYKARLGGVQVYNAYTEEEITEGCLEEDVVYIIYYTIIPRDGEKFAEKIRYSYNKNTYYRAPESETHFICTRIFTTCQSLTSTKFTIPLLQAGMKSDEISLSVPANANCTVENLKVIDQQDKTEADELQKGHKYRLQFTLMPAKGYRLGSNYVAYCNSIKMNTTFKNQYTYAECYIDFSLEIEEISFTWTKVNMNEGAALRAPTVSVHRTDRAEAYNARMLDSQKNPVSGQVVGGETYYLAFTVHSLGPIGPWETLNIVHHSNYTVEIIDGTHATVYIPFVGLHPMGKVQITYQGFEEGLPVSGVTVQITGNATVSYEIIDQFSYAVTDGVFERGNIYSLRLSIVPLDGYFIPYAPTVEVNGKIHINSGSYSSSIFTSFRLDTRYKIETAKVNVSGVGIGKTISKVKITVPSNCHYDIEEERWSATNTSSTTFKKGELYQLRVNLECSSSYRFTEDTVFTIGGKEAFDIEVHGDSDEIFGTIQFSYRTKVTKVTLPAMPKSVSLGATLPTNFKVSSSAKYTLQPVWVALSTQSEATTASQKDSYILTYVVIPKKGYEFTEDTVFYVDGKKVTPMLASYNGAEIMKVYNVGLTEIDRIDLTVAEPEKDAIPGTVTVPADAPYAPATVGWGVNTSGKLDDSVQDAAVFENYKYHFLGAEFVAADGYAFADKVTVYINGSKFTVLEDYAFGPAYQMTVSFGKLGDIPKLTAPELSTSGATLSWDVVRNADSYEIYRATSKSGKYTKVGTVAETTWTDSPEKGKTYYYKVKAIFTPDTTKNSSYSAVVSIVYKCDTPVISVENAASGKPVISWNKVSGAKQYTVYVATAQNGTYKKLGTSKTLSYTDSKAKSGNTYFYKVIANGSKSTYDSGYSNIVSCGVICGTPSVSVKVDAANGKPTLSWKKVDAATGYAIYRDGELLTTVTAVTYADTSAAIDTQYSYAVQALGKTEDLNGSLSKAVSATSGIAQPAAKGSVDTVSGKPVLTWEAVGGAVKYEIYRSTKSSTSYKLVTTVEELTYTDETVSAGKTYYYKVKAIGAVSKSADSSYVKLTGKCERPTIYADIDKPTGKPKISWEKVAGAKNYEVYRSTNGGSFKKLGTTTKLFYTDTKATIGGEYVYKVKAVGSKSSYNSEYSLAAGITAVCGQPSVKASVDAVTGKPSLTWSKVSGAVRYDIYLVDADGSFGFYTSVTEAKFLDQAAQFGQSYSYRVVAIPADEYYYGSLSATATVTATCAQPKATGKVGENNKPVISWEEVEGATKYVVYRSTSKSKGYKVIGEAQTLTYEDLTAKKGKTYYYKVVAVGENCESAQSSYVKIKSK